MIVWGVLLTPLCVLQQQDTHPSISLAVGAALWTGVLAMHSAKELAARGTHTTNACRCALMMVSSSAVVTKLHLGSLREQAAISTGCTSGQARRAHCDRPDASFTRAKKRRSGTACSFHEC